MLSRKEFIWLRIEGVTKKPMERIKVKLVETDHDKHYDTVCLCGVFCKPAVTVLEF